MKRALVASLVLAALLWADLAQRWLTADPAEPALCSTDSECAALCPPSEPDCDGGPQPLIDD